MSRCVASVLDLRDSMSQGEARGHRYELCERTILQLKPTVLLLRASLLRALEARKGGAECAVQHLMI